jgi:hypothetical protein
MALYSFVCKCGSVLVLPSKVRPNCRNPKCGKQMKLHKKVSGPVMYTALHQFNADHGIPKEEVSPSVETV